MPRREPPRQPFKRRGEPAYLVRWLTRTGDTKEAQARGVHELGLLIDEIESEDGDLMVAVSLFGFRLT